MAYTDYLERMQEIYIGYYQRPADPEGLLYWAAKLDAANGDLSEIIDAFANSDEATALYGTIDSTSIESVIDDIYTALFGRTADDEGKAFYADGFNAGTFTAATIMLNILDGATGEDSVVLANKVTAADLFTTTLDPELDGRALQATYAGDDDAAAGRAFLVDVGLSPVTIPNQAETTAYIQTNIADAGDPIGTTTAGTTYTLTAAADAPVGTAGDDLFVATEATLSSADVLDGADGTDTLRYASSGAVAVNEAGFEADNIEVVQVTSDATGGTTFDVTGVTGLETLRNYNSSEDLTLTGMDALADVELESVGSAGALANDPTPDTFLVFDAAVVAGAADELNVTLDTNLNVDGTAVGDLTANGVEIFNVMTENSASTIGTIISNTLDTVNVAGDQDLTISNNLVGATTVDASTFTGDLSVVVDSGAVDVVVTGGTGDDTADFSNGWDAGDAFDGGDGTDTLGLTYAVATGVVIGGTAANVEILDVTTAANVNGTIDMDNFASIETVILNAGIDPGVTATIDDAVSGLEVEVDVDNVATGSLVVDLATDGVADELTITLDNIGAGDAVASINAADAETLNISADDDTVAGNGTLTLTSLTATDATTLNLSGDADITIVNTVDPATPALTTIDASGVTGDLTISNTNTSAAGAAITLGSGDDTFNVATSNGSDTITVGDGADTIVYTAVAQSDDDIDTITDFVSGEDIIDVDAILALTGTIASTAAFIGNRDTFALAQGALVGGGTASIVFQEDEQILWVDSDGNGTLDDNDFRVKLTGVTGLTAADLGFGTGVTFTANKAGFDTWLTADSVEGVAVTNEDDVINATVAQITAASWIDGLAGTDVLNISATSAFGEIADVAGATLVSVEQINLANSVEGIILANADLALVGTLAGASGKTQSLEVIDNSDLTGTNITNIETLLVDNTVTATIDEDNFASFATITGTGAATLELDGNAATDDFDFSAVAMTGITTLTLTQADDVTFDAADLADVTTIGGVAGSDLFINNTVDISGIAVTDAAVSSITVAGNLTIINTTDGDEFETITGAGGTLTVAAGGATNIFDLSGFATIDATALVDGDVLTLNDDVTDGAVTIAIGDSDLTVAGGTSTDDLTVNALGGVANQVITTDDGDDTINIDVAATAATVDTGAGADTINAGDFLTVADTIDGGLGADVLNVGDDAATTDLDGVTNVETINITNTNVSSYQPADTVVAAGDSITVDASTSAAAVTMDFSLELDGQVNYVASALGDTITFSSNNLVDAYTLGAGLDTVVLDANNTIANLANVDSITDFKDSGADTLDSGTAHVAGLAYTVNLASTTLASFVGDVNAGLAALAGYAGAATDAIVVNVTSGTMAGTYLIQDLIGDSVTADDFVVELVGSTGVITAADFV
jgi:hypothetical protein